MLDLNDIQGAIYTYMWTTANDFKTACSGGLFDTANPKDPEDVSYPYAVYRIYNVSTDRDSSDKFPKIRISVDVFDDNDKSASTANSVFKEFDSRFDDCEASLSMTNYNILNVTRINGPTRIPEDSKRAHITSDYEIWLQSK